jgi:hypothetical protein
LTEVVAAGIDIVLVDLLNGELKVSAFSLPLNVVQSPLLNAPRFEADAVGKLNVWAVPDELIAKSVPVVPTLIVCIAPVNELMAVMPVPANIPACCVTVKIAEAVDGGGLPAAINGIVI